jgi:hypothetical protein
MAVYNALGIQLVSVTVPTPHCILVYNALGIQLASVTVPTP